MTNTIRWTAVISGLIFLAIALATLRFVTFTEYFFPENFIPIVQGWTDETTTQISMVYSANDPISFSVVEKESQLNIPVEKVNKYSHPDSRWLVQRISLLNLKMGQTYVLKVSNRKHSETREFSTLDTKKSQARIVFGSCINKNFPNPNIWKSLENLRPEMVLFLGDQTYADKSYLVKEYPATPDQLWQSYVASFHSETYYAMSRLIPTMALWDDHDYGANDSDSSYIYKNESLTIINQWFPQDSNFKDSGSIFERGPGDSSYFSISGIQIFLLDGRFFRSPVGVKPETFFGSEQEQWLNSILEKRLGPALIASGSSFFGAYAKGESYEGEFPESFPQFIKSLRKFHIPIIFASGDLHYSEAMRIDAKELGFETFEFLSSAFHSNVYPHQNEYHVNPRRIASVNEYNFMLLESNITNYSFNAKVSSWGDQGQLYFEIPFGFRWTKDSVTNQK